MSSEHETVIELERVKKGQKIGRMFSMCGFGRDVIPDDGVIVRVKAPYGTLVYFLRDSDLEGVYKSETGKVNALSYNDGKDRKKIIPTK